MYFYLYVLFFFTGNSVLLLFMTEGWGCMRMPIFQINMPVRNKWECIGTAPPRLRIAILYIVLTILGANTHKWYNIDNCEFDPNAITSEYAKNHVSSKSTLNQLYVLLISNIFYLYWDYLIHFQVFFACQCMPFLL